MTGFSTHCFRDFKRFIGELTAASAGIHSAILNMGENIKDAESKDAWAEVAKQYEIKVDGLKFENVLESSSRLNIVSVYSGFDLFLSSVRKELFQLTKVEWKAKDSDTPFTEFRNNLTFEETGLTSYQIAAIDYYRLARNAIVHPSQGNIDSASKFYRDNESDISCLRNHYKMRSAPNSFEELNFHDVKLISRTLLDLLPKIDSSLDPGDERLCQLIPFEQWKRYSRERQRNSAIGFLKNKGLD